MQEHDFFKSAFSVDCVVFGFDAGTIKVLLIRRGQAPQKGTLALPGDLVYPSEDLNAAAGRVLEQLSGISDLYMEQVHTFGRVDRHPMGRVITVAYYALVNIRDYEPHAADAAESIAWYDVREALGMEMGFDHSEILATCFERLEKRVRVLPIGFELLPKKFTLSQMQELYEAVLFRQLEKKEKTGFDKRNFRKKILSLGILKPLDEKQKGVAHRPARLYTFEEERYQRLIESGGLGFEI